MCHFRSVRRKIYEYKEGSTITELLDALGRILDKPLKRKLLSGITMFVRPADMQVYQDERLLWELTGEPLVLLHLEPAATGAPVEAYDRRLYSGILQKQLKIKDVHHFGFQVIQRHGRYFVSGVQARSKAEKRGLRDGDELLAVAKQRLQRMIYSDVISLLTKHHKSLDLVIRSRLVAPPPGTPQQGDWLTLLVPPVTLQTLLHV
jgi:hypothetical protein